MKKALGLLAIAAGAVTYAAYKLSHEEPTEEERIIHDATLPEEVKENKVESEEVIEEIKKDDTFIAKSFPNLNEADIIEITKSSEEVFSKVEMNATEERPIQHTVKFDDEIDLEEFKSIVISQGYVITNGEDNDLIVLHISKLDQDDILAKVFYLADLVKEHNGTYKGWIIK